MKMTRAFYSSLLLLSFSFSIKAQSCTDLSDYLKGEILFESKSYAKARSYFYSKAKNNPNTTAYYYHSKSLFYLDQFGQALEVNNKAIKLNPQCPELQLFKGQILKEMGSYIEAIQAFNKAKQLGYDIEEVLRENAETKILLKDFKNAKKDLTELLKVNTSTQNSLVEVEFFQAQKKYKESIVKLNNIINKDQKSDKAYFLLAIAHMENKDIEKSVEAYNKSSAISSTYSDPNLTDGIELYMDGNQKEACKTWKATGKLAKPLAKELLDNYCK